MWKFQYSVDFSASFFFSLEMRNSTEYPAGIFCVWIYVCVCVCVCIQNANNRNEYKPQFENCELLFFSSYIDIDGTLLMWTLFFRIVRMAKIFVHIHFSCAQIFDTAIINLMKSSRKKHPTSVLYSVCKIKVAFSDAIQWGEQHTYTYAYTNSKHHYCIPKPDLKLPPLNHFKQSN